MGFCVRSRWDKEVYDMAQNAQKEGEENQRKVPGTVDRSDHDTIASQAQALLSGKQKWRPSWMDYGPAREVELELDVSRPRAQ